MVDQCRHADRDSVIELCSRQGWVFESETAKAIRFSRGGFALNFNGEDAGYINLVFDPIVAGANFILFLECGAKVHERFSSNFRNFPKKKSKNARQNHFGVGLKLASLTDAEAVLQNLQLPELVR
ncbi:hypothetical protein [Hyphomonas sp.]|jgi:hypothetical protein|uniref:hypothetical protein n=1 Tax=Hyphomonas sp. TaxID=87 RepID=UPI0032D99B6A